MLNHEFYLFKVSIDKKTGSDLLQAVNREDDPITFDRLFEAMRRLFDEQAGSAGADDCVILQVVRKRGSALVEEKEFAFTYPELGLILEQRDQGDYDDGRARVTAFCERIETMASAGVDALEEPN